MNKDGQGWTGMDKVLLDSFSEIKVPLATSEQVSPDVEREARSAKKQGSLCDVMIVMADACDFFSSSSARK